MHVYYTPRMVADSGSFSPSAAKPAQAVAAWQQAGLPIELVAPPPATLEQLYRAHDPAYVDAVLACRRPNGFGNRSQAVADSLRYTSGAMVAAAQAALMTDGITCAPVAGFHHAGYDFGGGYCTFNGLMVAALEVLASGLAQRVGILDCDMHYGNGTAQILRQLDRRDIVHFSAGDDYGQPVQAADFLAVLPRVVARHFGDCDVLLYQAGADPHINDPLGGWLTTEQLAERDRLVFTTARSLGVPVAWNLAGGYQRDADGGISQVLMIHTNTLQLAMRVLGKMASGSTKGSRCPTGGSKNSRDTSSRSDRERSGASRIRPIQRGSRPESGSTRSNAGMSTMGHAPPKKCQLT